MGRPVRVAGGRAAGRISGGIMHIVACIEDRAIIRRILSHLRLWEEPEPRPPPLLAGRQVRS